MMPGKEKEDHSPSELSLSLSPHVSLVAVTKGSNSEDFPLHS
jgi:hypothetical protein